MRLIIYHQDLSQHIETINDVLRILTENQLKVKVEKCRFGYSSISVLGHIIGEGSISPDTSKLNNLWKFPVPQNSQQLHSFVGTINYLREYIPNYAEIAKPLNDLKKCKTNFKAVWTDSHLRSFNQLKDSLRYNIKLHIPDWNLPFFIATDASNHSAGAILYQQTTEVKKIIKMESKSLNDAQQRYSNPKKELLAVVYAFTKFYNYIVGRKFTLLTDHQSLITMLKKRTESNIINNWLWLIQQHDFEVVHLPGISNIIPDKLSRIQWQNTEPKLNLLKGKSINQELDQYKKQIYMKIPVPIESREELIKETHEKYGHCSARTLFQEI